MEISTKNYKAATEGLVIAFCKKQDLYFDGWVGDKIGTIAECSDLYFNMTDVFTDIQENVPVGLIIEWYYDMIDVVDNDGVWITYSAYIRGMRPTNN